MYLGTYFEISTVNIFCLCCCLCPLLAFFTHGFHEDMGTQCQTVMPEKKGRNFNLQFRLKLNLSDSLDVVNVSQLNFLTDFKHNQSLKNCLFYI